MRVRQDLHRPRGSAGSGRWPVDLSAARAGWSWSSLRVLTLGPGNSPIDEAFRQGLGDFGYVVGQNILLENRFAAGKADRLDQFAAELVAAKVDVILSSARRRRPRYAAKQTPFPLS